MSASFTFDFQREVHSKQSQQSAKATEDVAEETKEIFAVLDVTDEARLCESSVGSQKLQQIGLPSSGSTVFKVNVGKEDAAKSLGLGSVTMSDLVPGSYEGGFKLWEGGVDLADFLACQWGSQTAEVKDLKGCEVLELGCGHGLPGIVAALHGASVTFQDYNKEVLLEATAPNVAANMRSCEGKGGAARYLAASWSSMSRPTDQFALRARFDYVLASEVLYEQSSMQSLLSCIIQCLKPPNGKAYIANKTQYFGVGGCMTDFKELIKKAGMLEANRMKIIDDGLSQKREIWELSFPYQVHPYFL